MYAWSNIGVNSRDNSCHNSFSHKSHIRGAMGIVARGCCNLHVETKEINPAEVYTGKVDYVI